MELGVSWKEASLHAVGRGRDLEAGKKEKEKERIASHSISSVVDFSGGTSHYKSFSVVHYDPQMSEIM